MQDGLEGGEVVASQAGGAVVDTARVGVTIAAGVAAAGIATAFFAATAPVWAVAAVGAGVALGVGWLVNKANEDWKVTENAKHVVNSVVKAGSDAFEGIAKGIGGWFR